MVLIYLPLSLSLGYDIPIAVLLFAACLVMLVSVLPLTPGGVGVNEAAFVTAAGMVGVDPEKALAMVLLARAILIIIGLLGGLLQLIWPVPFDRIRECYLDREEA